MEEGQSAHPVALWHWRIEHIGLDYVDAMVFGNLDPNAAPPMGVSRWPGPREVFASPSVLNMVGSEAFIARYGSLAGVIDTAALADPGERLVYAGAAAEEMDIERSYEISGFGTVPSGEDVGFFGTALEQQPVSSFDVGAALFLIAPFLVLMKVAGLLTREQWDRRAVVLRVIGASPGTIRNSLARQVVPPVAAGAIFGSVLAGAAMLGTWMAPMTHYWVVGSDLRPVWWVIPLAALGVVGGMVGLSWFVVRNRHKSIGGTRPVPIARPAARWPVPLLFALVVGAYLGYVNLFPSDPGLAMMVVIACAAGAVVATPPALAVVIRAGARMFVSLSRRKSRPAALMVGRQLQSLSSRAVRTCMALAAVLIVGVMVGTLRSIVVAEFQTAIETLDANADLTVQATYVPPPDALAELTRLLPEHLAVLAISQDDEGGSSVWGTCSDLESVAGVCEGVLPSTTLPVAQAGYWLVPGTPTRSIDALADLPADFAGRLVMVSLDGTRIDIDQLAAIFNTVEPTPIDLAWPGLEFAIGAEVYLDQARWFVFGGIAALVIMALTAGLALAAQVQDLSVQTAAVGALVGRRGFFLATAAGIVGFPLLGASGLGALVGVGLVLGPTAPGMTGTIPLGMVWTMLASVAVAAAAATLIGAKALQDAASAWSGRSSES
ncbi:MAG: hypothetical protein LBK59_05055 [Bifidobacteriaceae bacterium]|nr:hypothetical protein [Bifidobacteriaceae bacterium]